MLLIFVGVWLWLAGYLSNWSDDGFMLSAARGFLLTGEPSFVDIERCGQLTSGLYHRAFEVSRWISWSFQIFGESLLTARLVPFIFTLGTWLLYVSYTSWRGYTTAKQVLIVSILFFAQSMVLEKSLAVRMYAPLLFFLLLTLIALWEAGASLQQKKRILSLAWLTLAGLAMWFTVDWHLLHFPIALLAIILLWATLTWDAPANILRRLWAWKGSLPILKNSVITILLLAAAIGALLVGPRVVDTLGLEVLGSQRIFLTPWDNLFGLLRFGLVVNILLLIWWKRSQLSNPRRDFNSWILTTGVISSVLVAVLFNSHLVFYTRYFYLSVGLVALGAAPLVAGLSARSYLPAALGVYVLLNGLVSYGTFYLDRADIKSAISWLKANTNETDIIFSSGATLFYHDGTSLCDRTVPLAKVQEVGEASEDPEILGGFRTGSTEYRYKSRDAVGSILKANPSAEVYFVYKEFHKVRSFIYRWTTGREREPVGGLYRFLKDGDFGEPVLSGMGSGGLRRLDTAKLLKDLENEYFP